MLVNYSYTLYTSGSKPSCHHSKLHRNLVILQHTSSAKRHYRRTLELNCIKASLWLPNVKFQVSRLPKVPKDKIVLYIILYHPQKYNLTLLCVTVNTFFLIYYFPFSHPLHNPPSISLSPMVFSYFSLSFFLSLS